MTPLVTAIALSACIAGVGSQYAPGVMERVVTVRQHYRTAYHLPTPMPNADGAVAVADCSWIGDELVIVLYGKVETFTVADCAGSKETLDWMRRGNILVEFDYQTALRHGFVGRAAKPIFLCERRQMKKTRYTTPDGKTVTLRGDVKKGKYLLRDGAREYMLSTYPPPALHDPPRITRVDADGSLLISTPDSLLDVLWKQLEN